MDYENQLQFNKNVLHVLSTLKAGYYLPVLIELICLVILVFAMSMVVTQVLTSFIRQTVWKRAHSREKYSHLGEQKKDWNNVEATYAEYDEDEEQEVEEYVMSRRMDRWR